MGDLLVYKASAGSGKTYNLALEFIKLAIQDGSDTAYRHILAVTFTNKATGEMKNRILVQLFNLSYGGLDGQFLDNLLEKLNAPGCANEEGAERRTPFTRAEVCKRARSILQNIIHDYDHFRVETIDSFFQSLLTNLAHELELPRTFRVDLNDKEVVARAVERLMAELQDKRSKASKDGTMRRVLEYIREEMENERNWKVTAALTSFAQKNLTNTTYLSHEEELAKAINDDEAFGKLRKFITEEEPKLAQNTTALAQQILDFIANCPGGDKRFSRGNNVVTYTYKILAQDWNADKSKTVLNGAASYESLVKKSDLKKTDVVADAQQLSALLVQLLKALKTYELTVNTATLTISKANPMRLLSQIDRLMGDINEETNHVMLSKTPELFSRVVKADDAPFVFERVGTTFKHIMIDEFQDTSRMQWNNFHKLLVENMANGHQCMLVGDIKQSIYRWRGGDWEILDNVASDRGFFSKQLLSLDVNWRSRANIVTFNNALFENCAPLLDSKMEEYGEVPQEWRNRISGIYRDVAQKCKPHAEGGWVRLALCDKKTKDNDIYEDVVGQIRQLHDVHGVEYSDMGILVRKNDDGVALINHITKNHPDIPINSDEAFRLTSSRSIVLLMNALRYLADDHDKQALALLAAGFLENNMAKDDKRLKGKYAEGFDLLLKDASAVLPPTLSDAQEREMLRHMPLYELCQRLITELNLANAKTDGTDNGQSAYLFYFLDAVLDFLADNPSDITLFIDYWENVLSTKSTTGDHNDCIYVMTVHKSKGLSRHTILIPFCDWDICKFRNTDTLWCKTPDIEPFNALPITAICPNLRMVNNSLYAKDKQSEAFQQYIDNLNTLYVAFTRAEENLLIWARALGSSEKAISNVGQLVAQASVGLLTPEPVEIPEEQQGTCNEAAAESTFAVSTSGTPMPSKRKNAKKATVEDTVVNPLDNPRIVSVPMAMPTATEAVTGGSTLANTEFRQSNPAKDFLSDVTTTAGETTECAEETTSTRQYIDRGKLLHRIFQQIGSTADLPRALQSLTAEGVTGDREETEELRQHIVSSLQHPQAKSWFDGNWTLFNECEILYRNRQGELKSSRPDRVMVKNGETIVVDFKFAKPDAEHQAQVGRYMQQMHAMGHQNVKGYVWYVLQNKVCPVAAETQPAPSLFPNL